MVADVLAKPAEQVPDPQDSEDATKKDSNAVIGVAQEVRRRIADLGASDVVQARGIATALVRATVGYELSDSEGP